MKRCTHCKKIKPLADFKTDKRRSNGKASWCKMCSISSCVAWRTANPEKVKLDHKRPRIITEARRKWRQEYNRKYRKVWRLANLEKARAYNRSYIQKLWKLYPEKMRAINRAKEARRRDRLSGYGGGYTSDQIEALKRTQRFKCANCLASIRKRYHADHVLPIALGGHGAISNIQLLCPPCNLAKGAKHPVDWAQENGRLI